MRGQRVKEKEVGNEPRKGFWDRNKKRKGKKERLEYCVRYRMRRRPAKGGEREGAIGGRFGQRRPWATCHSRSALFTSLRLVFFRAFVAHTSRGGSYRLSTDDTFRFDPSCTPLSTLPLPTLFVKTPNGPYLYNGLFEFCLRFHLIFIPLRYFGIWFFWMRPVSLLSTIYEIFGRR